MRGPRSHPGEIPAQAEAGSSSTTMRESFCHHFENDDLVVDGLTAVRCGALGRRTAKRRKSAEAFRQVLTDRDILFGVERSAVVVIERQKYLNQVHYGFPLWKRQHANAINLPAKSTA